MASAACPTPPSQARAVLDHMTNEQLRDLFKPAPKASSSSTDGTSASPSSSSGDSRAAQAFAALGRASSSSPSLSSSGDAPSSSSSSNSSRSKHKATLVGRGSESNLADPLGEEERVSASLEGGRSDRTKAANAKSHAPLSLQDLLACPLSNIFEVRLGQADVIRKAGNDAYRLGDIAVAVQLYERALVHCSMREEKMSADTFKLRDKMYATREPIHLNLARCCLKQERFRDCISHCKSVSRNPAEQAQSGPVPADLELKALVISARAHIELGEYEVAEASLGKAESRAEAVIAEGCTENVPPRVSLELNYGKLQKDREKEAASGGDEKQAVAIDPKERADALRAIVACAPQLRQSIVAKAKADARQERSTWTGRLQLGTSTTESSPSPVNSILDAVLSRAVRGLFDSTLISFVVAALIVYLSAVVPAYFKSS